MPPQSQNDSKTEHEGRLLDGFRKRQNKPEDASLRSDGLGRPRNVEAKGKNWPLCKYVTFDTGKSLPWASEYT